MFNRYAYTNNNPYRYVDPDGRAPENIRSRRFRDALKALVPKNSRPGRFLQKADLNDAAWKAAQSGDRKAGLKAIQSLRELNIAKGIPNLKGTTNRGLMGEALGELKKLKGSAKDKADLFEKLVSQINVKGGGFTAGRSKGADGSEIFMGVLGEILVISPAGKLFRGSLKKGSVTPAKGGKSTPNFNNLREVK